ncbi:ABC transporter ATP-binding protein [Pseudomonas sp. 09C 129]|uniref:ABC transporter ATP-binding protein n=1 Tax=Pseudomonas TaxID=286 RepID=UPI000B35A1FA|nr:MULTISPECIES: ABC transporter ATP-binding protein [Pseudomonas]AUG01630.1 ABC transporter ATP-binding protein [Pseudomonas sp. 09C 129]PMY60689.1 high-affinity branched-chain amino acid ABC transporter ATP-binding protein LivF [Pseudomonas sp. FW305-25]PMY63933.1 high-affinity branched-chain amino acid ABC transporter ATP-binding protein LivF [Pseudomonas sp. FW126-L8]PNA75252.1 high-affinity branched-chain amino acid ABC transporter ATP-binding protein LivF [Pseudomonas sp. FW305-76]
MNQLLEVSSLCVAYGGIEAVKGISLSIDKDEIVSLIGSNGAGKTTTLRAISGLLPCKSGKVSFQGKDITTLSPDARVRMRLAHVPEGRHVFPGLTIEENIKLGSYTRHDRKAIADDIEDMYQLFPILKERRKQQAGTMSGGEQQMLAIARAMMSRPELLILDEPTMGLSPKMIEVVLDTLREIRSRKTPILLVEQNTVEAIQMATRVYALRVGEIVSVLAGESVTEEALKDFYLS